MKDSLAAATSRLGKGSEARGRLIGSGSVEILGQLTGEVDWTGLVVIGPDARLVADARVDSLDLSGVLEGRVVASDEVFVRRGSRWVGGCVAPKMSTEAGAWVEGEFRVRPPASP